MHVGAFALPRVLDEGAHLLPLGLGLLEVPGAEARPVAGDNGCEV